MNRVQLDEQGPFDQKFSVILVTEILANFLYLQHSFFPGGIPDVSGVATAS
jgi:hypothetical protein